MNVSSMMNQTFCGIPASHVLIPPTAALATYLIPIAIGKIFPIEPDRGPLARLRHEIAYVHFGRMRILHPEYFRYIHVDMRDNLHIAVFFLAITILRGENQHLRDPIILVATLLPTLPFATLARKILKVGLLKLSRSIPRDNPILNTTAQLSERVAYSVAPSSISFIPGYANS